jgi:purine-binding chemotaxis protein CheW
MSEGTGDATQDYITVVIGTQLFGIAVTDVQDVFSPQSITCVPLAPAEVGGVLNLRGRIVTVIDVRGRLGLGTRNDKAPAMAVGIDRGGESYGLMIDEVGEVLTLRAEEIERVPETLDAKWRAVSKGVYQLQDRLMVVLDVERLMSFESALRAA